MLTIPQNITLQTLVTRAREKWLADILIKAKAAPGDMAAIKAAKDTWYRDTLEAACGCRSTKDMNAGRDMERACAAFESLIGESFEWQTKAAEGDLRRAIASVTRINPAYFAGKFKSNAKDFGTYLRGIAQQRLSRPELPELITLSDGEMAGVIQAACIDANRWAKRAA